MNCLRIRPTWMNEERQVIGDVPLSTIMLPGTHNSGAYDTDDSVRGISLIYFIKENIFWV